MEVIEGKFGKIDETTLRENLQVVMDSIPEGTVGNFVVVLEVDGMGEMFTSCEVAETNLMLDQAKYGLLSFGTGEI